MIKTLHYRNCPVRVYDNLPQLSEAAAQHCVQLINEAILQQGRCHLALAGGTTPSALYALLAQPDYAQQIAWDKVHVYFGDERYVSHDSAESNYHMARSVLLDRVQLPGANIHPITTAAGDARKDAQAYARMLAQSLPLHNNFPVFDIVLLGMGEDGHTASLFPDTDILDEHDTSVAAVYVQKLQSWRISLTLPTINAARCIMVLVAGQAKALRLGEIFNETTAVAMPIQRVQPQHACYWYMDAAAAAGINT